MNIYRFLCEITLLLHGKLEKIGDRSVFYGMRGGGGRGRRRRGLWDFGGVSFGNCMTPQTANFTQMTPLKRDFLGGCPPSTKKVIPGILYCKKLKEQEERSILPKSTKVATDLLMNHSSKITL